LLSLEFSKLCLCVNRICLVTHEKQLLSPILKACGDGDTCGSFDLVAGEHPDLNASTPQRLDGRRYFILQLI